MTTLRFPFALIATVLVSGTALAQPAGKPEPVKPAEPASVHVLKTGTDLTWLDGPAALPKGAKLSVLEGDPSKPGPFTIRLKLPAKYTVAPHSHPAIEHVTVISGDFYMGMGETFDAKAATKLPVGGFAVMPIKHAHFAFTKKKTVVQVHGVGPWGITYVNPADDPRTAAVAAPAAPAAVPAKR